jgi:hypothetical protein
MELDDLGLALLRGGGALGLKGGDLGLVAAGHQGVAVIADGGGRDHDGAAILGGANGERRRFAILVGGQLCNLAHDIALLIQYRLGTERGRLR